MQNSCPKAKNNAVFWPFCVFFLHVPEGQKMKYLFSTLDKIRKYLKKISFNKEFRYTGTLKDKLRKILQNNFYCIFLNKFLQECCDLRPIPPSPIGEGGGSGGACPYMIAPETYPTRDDMAQKSRKKINISEMVCMSSSQEL
jgi:hypothetical protein